MCGGKVDKVRHITDYGAISVVACTISAIILCCMHSTSSLKNVMTRIEANSYRQKTPPEMICAEGNIYNEGGGRFEPQYPSLLFFSSFIYACI